MRSPVDPGLFRRRLFSGNPPHAPHVYGFTIRFGRYATDDEKRWLRIHGYRFSGGVWARADRKPASQRTAAAWKARHGTEGR